MASRRNRSNRERTVDDELLDAAIDRAIALERVKAGLEADAARRFDRVLGETLAVLRRDLDRIHRRGGSVLRQRQVRDLFDRVSDRISSGVRAEYREMADAADELARLEAAWQSQAMRSALPTVVTVGQASAGAVRSLARRRPLQGRLMREWFSDVDRNAQTAIRKVVSNGLVRGETVDEMVEKLQGSPSASAHFEDEARAGSSRAVARSRKKGATLKAESARATKALQTAKTPGELATARRNMRTVVRTSTSHAVNTAREESYIANREIISGVRYVATLDGRTTVQCASLDGRVFGVGRGPRPPIHWNCRSTTSPIMKPGSDGELPDLESRSRRTVFGDVSASVNFNDWLKGRTIGYQNRILGKGRAELWRQGKLGDLSPDKLLRPDLTPKTLEQLRREYG